MFRAKRSSGRAGELLIVHNGREYRLRLTQNGKLTHRLAAIDMANGAQLGFRPSRASQRIGMAVAVALHAGRAALLTYEPARSALLAMAPIMVSLVTPPQPQASRSRRRRSPSR